MNTHTQFADAGVEALQTWFNPRTALWESTGWWNAANILWVLLDYAARRNTTLYHQVAAHIFAHHKRGNFLNEYYDDEGWWALTWIKAYDVTNDPRYLTMACTIFADMCGGWDPYCGGGIWWRKDRTYKNAIANELFFSLAASLSRHIPDPQERAPYLDWAHLAWNWFAQSGLINSSVLINDGLDANCRNNGGITWTYNQGVVLAGLVDMTTLTGNSAYLHMAEAIANATITTLVDRQGILHEPCEPNCGNDGPQFKGIFMRNLAYLYEADHYEPYRQFILRNSAAIMQKSRSLHYHFGLNWSAPVDVADAARQSSALDALNAAMSLAPSEETEMHNLSANSESIDRPTPDL
ncbi:MAG TPA: glycoside hydrolase family 76 protein [Ktedonobacteraceae bacterium]